MQFRADPFLFMPASENVPQFAGKVLGRFARRRPSPRRPEVNLFINAVPFRPPVDEAKPGCGAEGTILRNARDLIEPFLPKFVHDNKLVAVQCMMASSPDSPSDTRQPPTLDAQKSAAASVQ